MHTTLARPYRTLNRRTFGHLHAFLPCALPKLLCYVIARELDQSFPNETPFFSPSFLHSESSFFVSPHRLILKTCGTTLNLLGVPRILEIARSHAGLSTVYRCFYSRKAFMFPERQYGPHRDWRAEVEYLDHIFPNGAAYTDGKVNGDHWLLYITEPDDTCCSSPVQQRDSLPGARADGEDELTDTDTETDSSAPPDWTQQDYTIEILMSELSPATRERFSHDGELERVEADPHTHAQDLSATIGIASIFPERLTTLDAYSFAPCGYSSNALLKWREDAGTDVFHSGEGYYTIHVTPEAGWSYASFECNVPLPTRPSGDDATKGAAAAVPDLKTLVRRVVDIFQPGRLTLTLFISSADNATAEEDEGESAVEAAQRIFRAALTSRKSPSLRAQGARGGSSASAGAQDSHEELAYSGIYTRTDKINYEFGGYELAFASFELRP